MSGTVHYFSEDPEDISLSGRQGSHESGHISSKLHVKTNNFNL